MYIPQEPAIIHITHNMLNAGKGEINMWRVMHGQNQAGDDLNDKTKACQRPKIPEIIQVAGRLIARPQAAVYQRRDRQLLIEPLHESAFRLVRTRSHVLSPYPIFIVVSLRNAYGGITRLAGAGPLRIRPEVS